MRAKPWTIRDLLKVTADYLASKGIDSPRLDAELLLAHRLKMDRLGLYLNFDKPLTGGELSDYRSLIKRRALREPLHYITGTREFWSLDFMLDSHVLIPRPDTEIMVEQGLNLAQHLPDSQGQIRILDVGTGSGALAVSLAKDLQEAEIWATDISEAALEVARGNARKHHVEDRIRFIQGDLLEPLQGQDVTFHLLLSNPPYIPSEDYSNLPPEIRDYEPRIALDGGEGGMKFIERIIRDGVEFVKRGGWILLEMSPDQTDRALDLIAQTKGYGQKRRVKDYGQHYRVVMAQKAGDRNQLAD